MSLLDDEFISEIIDEEADPLIEEFDDSLSIDKQSIDLQVSDSLLEDDAIADLEAKSDPGTVSPSKKNRTIRVLGESASSGSSTPSATPSPGGSRTNSPRGVKRGRGRGRGANGLSKHVLKNGLHNVHVRFFVLLENVSIDNQFAFVSNSAESPPWMRLRRRTFQVP